MEFGPSVLTLTRVILTDNVFDTTPLSTTALVDAGMSAHGGWDAECSALQLLLSGTSCKASKLHCVTFYLTSHSTTGFFRNMQPSLQTIECT
jgi:hypothetical protein